MAVLRVVSNIRADRIEEVRRFYESLFGLDVIMDLGWIVTLSSGAQALTQLSIAAEGGGGAPVPDMSIEVTDVDDVYRRAKALGGRVVYDLRDEPWGVRRFFIEDPAGKLVNVLAHRTHGQARADEG